MRSDSGHCNPQLRRGLDQAPPRSDVSDDARGTPKKFRNLSELPWGPAFSCVCGLSSVPIIYAFGPFRLDAQANVLYRETTPVALGLRAVTLLRVLVEQQGVLVAKETLIDAAWPGLAIEDSNLTVQIAALRRALDRDAAPLGIPVLRPGRDQAGRRGGGAPARSARGERALAGRPFSSCPRRKSPGCRP